MMGDLFNNGFGMIVKSSQTFEEALIYSQQNTSYFIPGLATSV